MDIFQFSQEYGALFRPRSGSKVRSYPYPFRDIAEFDITYHAWNRMEKRQIGTQDVALILQHGRAMLRRKRNRSAVHIFLCPGELPKSKTDQKAFGKLWGVVLVVAPQQPVLITVLTNCFRWHHYIFRKPPLI
jgi:hypothetical protein